MHHGIFRKSINTLPLGGGKVEHNSLGERRHALSAYRQTNALGCFAVAPFGKLSSSRKRRKMAPSKGAIRKRYVYSGLVYTLVVLLTYLERSFVQSSLEFVL